MSSRCLKLVITSFVREAIDWTTMEDDCRVKKKKKGKPAYC